MATPDRTKSLSTPTSPSRSHRGPETLCLVCFKRWDKEMGRHLVRCKTAKGLYPDCNARRKLGLSNAKLFKRTCANIGPSLFFSMTELKKKASYSPFEVAELLRSFGHCAVPEEVELTYIRRPVYNNLTDRNFRREVEKDEKRQREENEKRPSHERLQQKRQAAVTILEPQDDSMMTDSEKQPKKPSQDEIDPPVLRLRDQLRGQKRKTTCIHLDDNEEESSQKEPSLRNERKYEGHPHLQDTVEMDYESGLTAIPSRKEKEKNVKRKQKEAEKRASDERLQQERQADVTISEREEDSVMTDEEKEQKRTNWDQLGTPVVLLRDILRGQKRTDKQLSDDDEESSQQGPSSRNEEDDEGSPDLRDSMERETESRLQELLSRKGNAPPHGKNEAKRNRIRQESKTAETAEGEDDGTTSGSDKRVLRNKDKEPARDTEEESVTDAEYTNDYIDLTRVNNDEETGMTFEKQQNFTKGTKAELMKIGWYEIPKQWFQCQIFNEFSEWYARQGKEDRTKDNNVRNMIKFLFKMSKGTKKEYSYEIITKKNFQEVCDALLNAGVNYQTLYNYFKSLKHFVRFETQRYRNLRTAEGDAKERKLRLEMFDIEEIGTTFQAKARDQKNKDKQTQDRPPTPFEVTAIMRSEAKGLVDKHLKSAEKGHALNRDQTALVNRYLVCHVLLSLGHRPASAERLTIMDVEFAFKHNRKHKDGRTMVCIISKDKEVENDHTAWIVLNGQILDFYERYAKFVRPGIVKRTQTSSNAFYLQYDGRAFSKISEAASKLQKQFHCEVITNDMARKSYMFYLQRCSEDVQKAMADYLGVSQ